MTPGAGLAAWRQNPFFVLGVPITASRSEVERAGQKLLLLLEMGNKAVQTCPTPLGPVERDADLVRAALAALRDPEARAVWELWANVAPLSREEGAASLEAEAEPWVLATRIVGWRK